MPLNSQPILIAGYFPLRAQAEAALEGLREAHFPQDKIGIASHALDSMVNGDAPIPGSLWDKVAHLFGSNKQEERERAADGLRAALEEAGIAPVRARHFVRRLDSREEGALITIVADGRSREAEQIIEAAGGDLCRNDAAAAASAASP